jgi:hypothetical protein
MDMTATAPKQWMTRDASVQLSAKGLFSGEFTAESPRNARKTEAP